ncbi:MAG TPA: DUF6600 domain-containing protein [Acidobacteriaceae bacterium]|nr:DUF6600 domain-containing protein [Acidobacteriaceae bacterium]
MMRFTRSTLAAAILVAAAVPVPALAQDYDDPPAIAARIAYLHGNVSLEAQGAQDWSVAPLNYPMVSGDRIYTDQDARAAIQAGSTDVRVGEGTDVTLTNLTEQYQQIGLAQGSIRVRVFGLNPGSTVEVDTPGGAAIIQRPGDYRVNVYPDQQAALVQVFAGEVQIAGPGVNQALEQGDAVQLYGTNPVEVGLVEMPYPDDLDRWSMERDRHIQYAASRRYVNPEVPGYDDLDDYGSWTPTSDYGPVWFPRDVDPEWQPYTMGYWTYVQPWGYTWVDEEPWGYAPFHYGRWVHWRDRWGWVPGPLQVRPVWGPAFVAFVGGGPGFSVGIGGGGVAWFPLGVGEPYVPWYRCSPRYVREVNITNVNITEIHNVTVVNNYNRFMGDVSRARTINDIHVNNNIYVMNRDHVVAMPDNQFRSGARVNRVAFHLDPQQRQRMASAPINVARPPAAAPAHPFAGQPRSDIRRPVARPVLMTTEGRRAATPTSNEHRAPLNLPRPAPPTAIRPAQRAVVPNVRPAQGPRGERPAGPGFGNREGQPAPNQPTPGQPGARPGQGYGPPPNVGRPGEPNRPEPPGSNERRMPQPGQPNPQPGYRPGPPERPNPQPERPGPQPGYRPAPQPERPAPQPERPGPQPGYRPGPPPGQPNPQPGYRPAPQPERPAPPPERPGPQPGYRPAPPPDRPNPQPEHPQPGYRPAPQPERPAPPPPVRPAPQPNYRPAPQPEPQRPAPQPNYRPAPQPRPEPPQERPAPPPARPAPEARPAPPPQRNGPPPRDEKPGDRRPQQ